MIKPLLTLRMHRKREMNNSDANGFDIRSQEWDA
jgi:hypothetical protein